MNALNDPRRRHLVVVAGLAVACNLVVALAGSGSTRAPMGSTELAFAAGYVLTTLLPGYLLAVAVFPRRDTVDVVERSVLSVGLGYVALVLGGLVVHALPGGITPRTVCLVFDAIVVALLAVAVARRAEGGGEAVSREVLVHVALVLVVGALFRLPWLGYAQLQGDEATILLKAAAAVEGRGDALFVHKKGPAEIVIPTLFYGLTGVMTETLARLPFALAMITGFVGLYQLGAAMFRRRVGLLAALLLAINGFFVGFGRVLQYQALVFLFSVLALLCAFRLYQDRDPPRPFLFLAISFVGLGLLAQYDIVFVVPAAAALVLLRWWDDRTRVRGDVVTAAAATALVAAVLAAYFIPWSQHPYFREATLPYLFDVRVGGDDGPLHNTLGNSLLLSTFYNSTYYMAFLAVTLASAIAYHLSRTGRRWVGAALAIVFSAGAVLLVAAPQAWTLGGLNVSLVFLAGTVLVLLASRSPSRSWKVQLLWFAAGFVFYATLVKSPRTHFHVAFPAWSVLSAWFLATLWDRLPSAAWRRAAGVGFAAAYAVFAFYPYLVFLQHDVEYKRTFPEDRPPGYWTVTDDLPTNGWFGFPYRAGWKAVGSLFEDGVLRGTYASNEEENITNWYTRGAVRCAVDPRYYIIADGVQDDRPVPSDMAGAGYGEVANVTVGDRTRLRIYERDAGAAPPGGPTVYRAETLAEAFDRAHSGSAFEPMVPYGFATGYVGQPLVTEARPSGIELGDRVRLLGLSAPDHRLRPGDELPLTLYWQGLAPMDKDYSVFVHVTDVGDPTVTVAQSDGAPGVCDRPNPSSTWEPGRVVLDRRAVRLPPDILPGTYELRGGLYDYETLERLPITAPDALADGGQAVVLGTIEVVDGP